jgi:hypothetical protein
MRIWTGFIWHKARTEIGSCEHRREPRLPYKEEKFLTPPSNCLASQENPTSWNLYRNETSCHFAACVCHVSE